MKKKPTRKSIAWRRPRGSKQKKITSPLEFTTFVVVKKLDALGEGMANVINLQLAVYVITAPLETFAIVFPGFLPAAIILGVTVKPTASTDLSWCATHDFLAVVGWEGGR